MTQPHPDDPIIIAGGGIGGLAAALAPARKGRPVHVLELDAAHPTLQNLAQGACMAIEDAVCLASKVAAHGGDMAAAFLAYIKMPGICAPHGSSSPRATTAASTTPPA